MQIYGIKIINKTSIDKSQLTSHKVLTLSLILHKSDMTIHICNLRTQEEAGGPDHPWLHSESEVRLGCKRH